MALGSNAHIPHNAPGHKSALPGQWLIKMEIEIPAENSRFPGITCFYNKASNTGETLRKLNENIKNYS